MFGSIAKQYDKTNAILSFNLHKSWNKQLLNSRTSKDEGFSYLDLCCGTGEIGLNFLKNEEHCDEAYLLDFCEEMLFVAKERARSLDLKTSKITFLQADAQCIPLTSNNVDFATMAYGIRNIPDIEKCFKDRYRVLKKSGQLSILELTEPTNPVLNFGHSVYLKAVLPVVGKLITSNKNAYEYLCNSIKSFTKPEAIQSSLEACGFKNVELVPLMGGIATLIKAYKLT